MNLFDGIEFVYNIDDEMKKINSSIDKKISEIKINDSQRRESLVIKSKVRSIHSSLSIEANSLSLFDVENINNDKQVIGKKDEIQNKIVELIINDKNITQNEIATILEKNVRTIKRNFKILIDNNIIERIGSDKTGYWIIKR